MTESREAEYTRLASQAAEIEKLVQSGSRNDAGYLLAPFLENVRSRMSELQMQETQAEHDKDERKQKETAAVAALVEREHNLNAQEREQYGEFLKLEYFTKANFGDLEKFYANTWDKLSEGGKTEMSHRVWEGIRHDEYSFDELPETVRKKEEDRFYQQLTGKIQGDPNLENVPQQDRADFIREHEARNEKAASQVLSRESFSKNVSTHSSKEASERDTSSKEKSADEKVTTPSGPEVRTATEIAGLSNDFEAETVGIKPTDLKSAGEASRVR